MARHKKLALTELLEAAKSVIEANGLTECPVCERAIDPAVLSVRLRDRIEADSRITALRDAVEERRGRLVKAIGGLSERLVKLFADCEKGGLLIPASLAAQKALIEDILSSLALMSSGVAKSFALRIAECHGSAADLLESIENAVKLENPGHVRTALSDASAAVSIVAKNWPSHAKRLKMMQTIEARLRVAERLHSSAVESRKAVVQWVLDQISETANRMYSALHPDEMIANSTLTVRRTEDGSVILENDFYGKTASPRLHLSESHLDTLGLCYFLALRKTEALRNPTFKFLILDDVLHSVDAAHRTRAAQLIKNEFSDHQLIVTTHDDIFFDRLRTAFGGGGIEHRKFHGWSIDHGPLCVEATSDLDTICSPDLRMAATAPELAAAAGRVFEWMLRELTERLEIAIPARFKRGHDIGSMWPPLSSKLKKSEAFQRGHANLCDDINLHSWVRNATGAHYNEFPSNVSPSEVCDFAVLLSELHAATFCKTCNEFISKRGSDVWQCQSGCLDYSRRAPSIHLASA